MPVADPTLIKRLNAVLKNKLTGINQYFLHARMLKHWGDVKLADQEYKASIDAMKHSDMLVEHILSLGGLPNLQELGTLSIGETPTAMLCNDKAHVESSSADIETLIALCHGSATASLLGKILESQRERIAAINTQLAEITHLKKDCA